MRWTSHYARHPCGFEARRDQDESHTLMNWPLLGEIDLVVYAIPPTSRTARGLEAKCAGDLSEARELRRISFKHSTLQLLRDVLAEAQSKRLR